MAKYWALSIDPFMIDWYLAEARNNRYEQWARHFVNIVTPMVEELERLRARVAEIDRKPHVPMKPDNYVGAWWERRKPCQ